MPIISFTSLIAWQKAYFLTLNIYSITESFPISEKFGLVSQIRRASTSIASNIAEGFTRTSAKDKVRFYEIAFGSTIEIYNHILISKGLLFINQEVFEKLEKDIIEVQKLLWSIRKGARSRI